MLFELVWSEYKSPNYYTNYSYINGLVGFVMQ
jgi:hypothetical protein